MKLSTAQRTYGLAAILLLSTVVVGVLGYAHFSPFERPDLGHLEDLKPSLPLPSVRICDAAAIRQIDWLRLKGQSCGVASVSEPQFEPGWGATRVEFDSEDGSYASFLVGGPFSPDDPDGALFTASDVRASLVLLRVSTRFVDVEAFQKRYANVRHFLPRAADLSMRVAEPRWLPLSSDQRRDVVLAHLLRLVTLDTIPVAVKVDGGCWYAASAKPTIWLLHYIRDDGTAIGTVHIHSEDVSFAALLASWAVHHSIADLPPASESGAASVAAERGP